MARISRRDLRRSYPASEGRCRACWEARVPLRLSLPRCTDCQARREPAAPQG